MNGGDGSFKRALVALASDNYNLYLSTESDMIIESAHCRRDDIKEHLQNVSYV